MDRGIGEQSGLGSLPPSHRVMKPKNHKQDGGNALIAILVALLLAPIWVPLLALWFLFFVASFVCLHLAVWTLWLPRRKRLLFVYSDSPVWREYVETRILPLIREQAVILNWSERRQWSLRHMLAVAVFRHFGGRKDFNPMAVVFQPLKRARVFRFFQPFHDFKRGKPETLAKVEKEFFGHLGLAGFSSSP